MNSSTAESSSLEITEWRVVKPNITSEWAMNLSLTATPTLVLERKYAQPVRVVTENNLARPVSLLDDPEALALLYAEFVEEDIELSQTGMVHYARMLQVEEQVA